MGLSRNPFIVIIDVLGIGLYLKCQYTEHGRDTLSALR